MPIRFEPVLTMLSVVLAFGTRYVMLEALSHILSDEQRSRWRWYAIAVAAAGGGVWIAAMTGFQAIEPRSLTVNDSQLITAFILGKHGLGGIIASLSVTMLFAYCFVYAVERGVRAWWGIPACSLLIVVTQTAAQFIGLLSMHFPDPIATDWAPFIALKVFNLFVNGWALYLFFYTKRESAAWERRKLFSSALMGYTVASSNLVLIKQTSFAFVPLAASPGEMVIQLTNVAVATIAASTLLLFFLALLHSHHESVRAVQLEMAAIEADKKIATADLERLKAMEQAKSVFVGTVSHELRTPLTAIVGYLELLSDEVGGPLTKGQREFVNQMLASACDLYGLVDRLIDVATLEAGKVAVKRQFKDLVRLVASDVQRLTSSARSSRVQLVAELPDQPLMMWLDPWRISQVIGHLVHNAIKFGGAGVTIRISVRQVADCPRVMVSDTGPGIAAEHLPRLFEKFFQVDSGLTRVHGGAGLGLALSKAIVEAHGGRIAVCNQPGAGSTFWFDLPITVDSSDPGDHVPPERIVTSTNHDTTA